MSVVFCDTDCELNFKRANEQGLKVIRMPYTIDGEERFSDLGEEFDAVDFYNRMRAGAKVSTSALNEEIYYDTFKPYFEAGGDILYIAFSSKMSGTFQSLDAAIARLNNEYKGVKFRRFDTLSICMGAGILVYLGAKYLNEHNGDIDATYDYLEKIVHKSGVYFVVTDMKYLARGGRISPAKAKIANLMNIKPVLTVTEEGILDVTAKKAGLKLGVNFMLERYAAEYSNDVSNIAVIIDADNKELADELEGKIKDVNPSAEIWRQPIGPVIGCHCGPGTVGLVFMR